MGWLDSIKGLVGPSVQKFSGQKDFLEGVCASGALVAAADGDVSTAEIEAATKAVMSNAALSAAFEARSIETTMDAMLQRAAGGRTGQAGLYKEIDDCASDPDKAEAVFLAALDVAEGDGNISAAEVNVLNSIANRLKIGDWRTKYNIPATATTS